MTQPLVIAIDGTFASGKGTLGKQIAAHYKLDYLDTGKLYRAVALSVIHAGGDVSNPLDGVKAVRTLNVTQLEDPALKSGAVAEAASKVAVHAKVRSALLAYQRAFAAKGAVLDGRDIGTVICPDAAVKLYIDAAAHERARRRHAELVGYGEDISFDTVLNQLKIRDDRDMNREIAPLKPAVDAHLLDTTNLSIERAFDAALAIIGAVLAAKTEKTAER